MDNETPQQPGEAAVRASGKTMADVLDDILMQPRKWFSLLLFLTIVSALIMLVMFVFTRLFDVETSEVQVGGSNSHVVFERVESRTGNAEYLVVVSPEGWQRTGIVVQAGSEVSFSAGGRICIDLNEIWAKVQLRKQYEEAVVREQGIRSNDPTENRVPEDFFTADEKRSLILDRPWVDPNGFSLDAFQPSFRSRRAQYLLPDKPAGGLIAAFKNGPSEPARADAFFVGSQDSVSAPTDGELWFTVNDVQFSDPNNRNLFYNDNIGTFWVKIVVKRR